MGGRQGRNSDIAAAGGFRKLALAETDLHFSETLYVLVPAFAASAMNSIRGSLVGCECRM